MKEAEETMLERVLWYIFLVVSILLGPLALGSMVYEQDGLAAAAGTFLVCAFVAAGMVFGLHYLYEKGEKRDAKAKIVRQEKQLAYEALPADAKLKSDRKEIFATSMIFTIVTVAYIGVWVSGLLDDRGLGYVLPAGAAFFGFMCVMGWISYAKGWNAQQQDSVLLRSFSWLIFGPIILCIVGVVLFFGISWLTSIPSWAAVIIVLLILVLFKKSTN